MGRAEGCGAVCVGGPENHEIGGNTLLISSPKLCVTEYFVSFQVAHKLFKNLK